jgi:NADPH:quinone reductase-like Zn-dependent oxidoreductase
MAIHHIPQQMKALELTEYDPSFASLRLVNRVVPQPAHNEVLVRMTYAPVNPSDLMFMGGTYVLHKQLPVVPGTVGSGVVVAAGSSLWSRLLLNRRISCAAPTDGDGTWAEYMVTSASVCIPLLGSVDLERGANLLSNPLTAFGLFELLRKAGHRCFIQNAAASDIARLLHTLATQQGMQVINIVRRPQQAVFLRSLGVSHVLDSSSPDNEAELRRMCETLRPSALVDSVGGEQTRQLSALLASGGEVILCGKLSGEDAQIPQNILSNRQLSVRAFSVMNWAKSKSMFETVRLMVQLQIFARRFWQLGNVRKALPDQVPGHVIDLTRDSTAGKTFIQFS